MGRVEFVVVYYGECGLVFVVLEDVVFFVEGFDGVV